MLVVNKYSYLVVEGSRIIHVLAVEGQDIIEHTLGFDGGTVGVELDGPDIAVDSLVPLPLLTKRITLKVIRLG